jgi:hypothetical protein
MTRVCRPREAVGDVDQVLARPDGSGDVAQLERRIRQRRQRQDVVGGPGQDGRGLTPCLGEGVLVQQHHRVEAERASVAWLHRQRQRRRPVGREVEAGSPACRAFWIHA